MKKFILAIIATIFGAFTSCGASEFKSVSPDEFEKVIADTTVQVLDVRTPDEFAEGHLTNAINIDVLADGFESAATARLFKARPVAVYCRSGRRSKKAANILVKSGFTITELDNGYMGWTAAHKPTVK